MTWLWKIIRDNPLPLWLVLLLTSAFILRIPSFFEPIWYGDEAIYLTVGEALRQGFILYRDIHDNKPPLFYMLTIFAGNLFWFKAILAFFALASAIFFWRIAQILFPKKEKLAKIATVIFAILTTIPLFEGNIANAEIFMLLPTLAAFFLLLSPKISRSRIFIAGLSLGMGMLFKVPAILDALPILVLWFSVFISKRESRVQVIKNILILGSALSLPLLFTFLLWALQGAFINYMQAAFLQTIDYLSLWRGSQSTNTNFLSQNQPLLLRGLLTLALIISLLRLHAKKTISTSLLFVGSWFASSVFALTLSERPYPHYLIIAVPSLALLVGFATTLKNESQFLPYPLFAIFAAVLVIFKFQYYSVFPYYQNFLAFALGQKSQEQYFDQFDHRTNRNYRIARFLTESASPKSKIFVWGNDPEIYVLSKLLPATRFVALYHIEERRAEEKVISGLANNPPKFIILTASALLWPQLAALLGSEYTLVRQEENTQIYLRINHLLYSKTK